MVSVAIFDYGAGNIFSLKNSLEQAGASVDVITSFDQPNVYSGLLLPGVGNFEKMEIWYRDEKRHIQQPIKLHQLQNHFYEMTKVHLNEDKFN